MFSLTVDDYNIAFTFTHMTLDPERAHVQAATICTLKVNDKEYSGTAACSVKDIFNKDKGRKIALARALKEARESSEIPFKVRDAIWHRYFLRGVPNKEYAETVGA